MSQKDSSDDLGADRKDGKFLPPVEFNSIIMILYFPALVSLGIIDDPAAGKPKEDLELAKRNIDLLELLKLKTAGNLEENENKFLDDALDQLRMVYLRKTEFLKM